MNFSAVSHLFCLTGDYTPRNLNRKALLSRSPTANLAFRRTIAHPTPSVFHADQRGMRPFLIQTLGLEFLGHPHPHGGEDGPRTLASGAGSKIYDCHVDQHEKLKGLDVQ